MGSCRLKLVLRITGIPVTLVIRPDGVAHAHHVGLGADYVETLKGDITEALGVE